MADWAISPTAETDWQFDPDDFAERLLGRWPKSVTRATDYGNRAVEFTASLDDGRSVDGYLAKTRDTVWLDGDVEPAAEIAAWVREQAPDDQELSFYDQAYEAVVPLPPGITAADIATAAVG
jgi:hypothetical protein